MKLNQSLSVILLSIWLILTGVLTLLNIPFAAEGRLILALLALVAGLFLLVRPAHLPRSLGSLLLAIWLILSSLLALTGPVFPSQDLILALVAIAAGVLLLLSGKRQE